MKIRLLKKIEWEWNSDGVYVYCVCSCSLCPLLRDSSPNCFYQVCEWRALILLLLSFLSLTFLPPPPTFPLVFSFSAHYRLSCDSLKSESIYSFIQSFSGKIFESLITSDSSPPFIFTLLLKPFWPSKNLLVYISTLTHLLSSTGRFFSLWWKEGVFGFLKRTFRYVFFS